MYYIDVNHESALVKLMLFLLDPVLTQKLSGLKSRAQPNLMGPKPIPQVTQNQVRWAKPKMPGSNHRTMTTTLRA